VTDKEALELSLAMLERDNLKVGNIYVNYDIQKALIKLIKKETKKKEWQGLTDEERNHCLVEADPCEALADPEAQQLMIEIEAKLREKNAREGE
jgi:hypothetical protein